MCLVWDTRFSYRIILVLVVVVVVVVVVVAAVDFDHF